LAKRVEILKTIKPEKKCRTLGNEREEMNHLRLSTVTKKYQELMFL